MGLGDEIMALGVAERLYEQTGKPVRIECALGTVRHHLIWEGNPAYSKTASQAIVDGGGYRPYIESWKGRKANFNLDYAARAGKIYIPESARASAPQLKPPYAIVAPFLKSGASPNKDWGAARWEQVIRNFPVPVYQLCPDAKTQAIPGAVAVQTPDLYSALVCIEGAAVVMAAEGGTHHMAASLGVPAVVVFGSFVPPQVTGYEFHHNIAVDTEHGYCGNWEPCTACAESLAEITPAQVRRAALLILESYDAD